MGMILSLAVAMAIVYKLQILERLIALAGNFTAVLRILERI